MGTCAQFPALCDAGYDVSTLTPLSADQRAALESALRTIDPHLSASDRLEQGVTGLNNLSEALIAEILSIPLEAWTNPETANFLNWAIGMAAGLPSAAEGAVNLIDHVAKLGFGLPIPLSRPVSDLFQPVQNVGGFNAAAVMFTVGAAGLIGGGVSAAVQTGGAVAGDAGAAAAGGVSTTVAAGGAAAGGASAAVSGAVDSSVAAGGSAAASTAGDVLGSIKDTIAGLKSAIGDIVGPIADTIHSVTDVVKDVNENLIKPITGPITSILDNYKALSTALATDLHSGITGLLRVPGDISKAVDSIDATMQRTVSMLGAANREVIHGELGPGVGVGVGLGVDHAAAAINGGLDAHAANERDNMIKRITEDPGLEDIQAIIDNIGGWLEQNVPWVSKIAGTIVNVLTSTTLIFSYLEAKQHFYRQQGAIKWPTTLLDVGMLNEAKRRGIITAELWIDQMRRLGFAPDRVDIIAELNRKIPAEAEAVEWLSRGLIERQAAIDILGMNGWREDDADRLLVAATRLPDATLLLDWYHRGLIGFDELRTILSALHFRPEDIDRLIASSEQLADAASTIAYLDRLPLVRANVAPKALTELPDEALVLALKPLGLSTDAIVKLWLNHWQLLPPPLAVAAWFRGYISRDQLEALLLAAAIPLELQQNYIDLQRPIFTLRNVPTLMRAGIIDAGQGRDYLQQAGYSLVDAEHMVQLALRKQATTGTASGTELHGIAAASILELLDDEAIGEDAATGYLTRMGMGPQAVQLSIALHKIKRETATRRAHVELVIAKAKAGHIDYAAAQDELHRSGLTQGEVERALAVLERDVAARVKLPTEAEVFGMFKHGIIDAAKAAETLGLIGFSEQWVQRLLALHGATNAPATPAG
jgi:hypothetical protein